MGERDADTLEIYVCHGIKGLRKEEMIHNRRSTADGELVSQCNESNVVLPLLLHSYSDVF